MMTMKAAEKVVDVNPLLQRKSPEASRELGASLDGRNQPHRVD